MIFMSYVVHVHGRMVCMSSTYVPFSSLSVHTPTPFIIHHSFLTSDIYVAFCWVSLVLDLSIPYIHHLFHIQGIFCWYLVPISSNHGIQRTCWCRCTRLITCICRCLCSWKALYQGSSVTLFLWNWQGRKYRQSSCHEFQDVKGMLNYLSVVVMFIV